ncbi:MAG: glutamate racemase [Deltaproteobacteria bacterium]|nr:glutamate racemase [Deltaproteobacteria bacterium]
MKNNSSNSIGVFDSGVGGLTVVKALIEQLPFENIIYFGDTARVPYGVKSVETITRYAMQITQFLLDQKVKLLIIACNTMSAVAYHVIRELSSVAVLDVVDAGARSAVAVTQNKCVVVSQACPLFVPLVEEGWLDHQVTKLTAQEYLKPVIAQNIDTLVLGCTHYPLLKPVLQEIMGVHITLVDSAQAITEKAGELLKKNNLLNEQHESPEYQFYVTDVPIKFVSIGEMILERTLSDINVVKW